MVEVKGSVQKNGKVLTKSYANVCVSVCDGAHVISVADQTVITAEWGTCGCLRGEHMF